MIIIATYITQRMPGRYILQSISPDITDLCEITFNVFHSIS